jgi:cysteine-rich repeat protein
MYRQTFCLHLCVLPVGLVPACTPAGSSGPAGASSTTGTTQGPEISPPTPTTETGDISQTTSESATTRGDPASETGFDSTGPALDPMCGDGQVNPGEACDNGVDNRDDGACTLNCEVAVCGDGLVQAGVEACDDGVANGDAYNGCSATCTRNGTCGDGVVQVPHEMCDAGAANGSGESDEDTAPCAVGCTWDARVVFTTSILLDGDLGGLEIADAICRARAAAGELPRHETYKAWLSVDGLGPLGRFTLLPPKPYVLRTGERIADNLTDLVIDGPIDGIRVDEFGAPVPQSFVWTGTAADGTPHTPDDYCGGWTSASGSLSALVGVSHQPQEPMDKWQEWKIHKMWTNYKDNTVPCFTTARLYCFEQ